MEYYTLDKAIRKVVDDIYAILDAQYIPILRKYTTPYKILVTLKRYFAPSNIALESQLLIK